MTPIKQTVYLREIHHYDWLVKSHNDDLMDHVKESEGYFFPPEQLNEYTQKVIRQALETAAKTRRSGFYDSTKEEQSITNTFEETFKKFEV